MKTKLGMSAIALAALVLVGCASAPKTTYIKKTNWIDDEDLLFARKLPSMNEWIRRVGNPAYGEISADTVSLYYGYQPALFNSGVDGVEYKPTNKDRQTEWKQGDALVKAVFVGEKMKSIEIADPKDAGKIQGAAPAAGEKKGFLPF